MPNLKDILDTFEKNTYYLIFMTILSWILVFLKPEWMYVWFYYSDPKNWLEDSTGYLFGGMVIFFAMSFSIFKGFLLVMQQKYKQSLPWIIVPFIVFFIMSYVADIALKKEVHPINYKQYLMSAKTSDSEANKVASMLNGDCQITVLELNEDLFEIYQWNPKKDKKFDIESCKTMNESKNELIDYLQGKGIL